MTNEDELTDFDKERIRDSIHDTSESMSDLEYYADHDYNVSENYILKVKIFTDARRELAKVIDNEFG